jgi:hypothetical protein
MARLDYRVTENGDAYLLEANPKVAKDEDFALSAKHVTLAQRVHRRLQLFTPCRLHCSDRDDDCNLRLDRLPVGYRSPVLQIGKQDRCPNRRA